MTNSIVDRFANMILGVNASPTLDEAEKTYLIDLLNEQLAIETETAEMLMGGTE